ncbi:cytochrome c oxidase subunit 2 [Halopseudomonas xinjiangensis]|uniref:Cytochrome aa3 subunit 2 n=1 Tax=Halopseudomonas xinjiangensis TaxID=487184 RepID=A0A1H1TWF3_9GAMM|nr:cytochrome c oxidase subunit II [Halopseudomonas xinjiangensis]SDS64625.1 cytochrome c oxidase subunit 2 [Halopseudomonas xinjiangensis]
MTKGCRSTLRFSALVLTTLVLGACDGRQSALHPAGRGAEDIAELFWWMCIGGMLIWVAVLALAYYVTKARPEAHSETSARWLILGGGVAFPIVVLTILLMYGLAMMPGLRSAADADLRIAVAGEQWWWRVRYQPEGSEAIELANEIRLPVGSKVVFELSSPDVIHSFWIPSLGGKMDMIPGRVNELVLEPTRTGVFRGVCAEYCGSSHALMEFEAVVMPVEEFDAWLAAQAQPAQPPRTENGRKGEAAFERNGCGACHSIRGTDADGMLGPDLTHVGSRLSLAAGTLGVDVADFERWIAQTHRIKPDAHMPAFDMLPEAELRNMAHYLSELK